MTFTGRNGRGRVLLRYAVALAGVWLVLLTVVVGVGWLITNPGDPEVDQAEDPISRWFAASRDVTLGHVADVGTLLGETAVGVTLAVALGAGFAVWRRTWRPLVLIAVVEAGLGGIYAIATTADPRARPPVPILDRGLVPDASFPSGHAATATAVAMCAIVLCRAYAPRAWPWVLGTLLLPALTVVSRLYEGAHHLSDVVTSVAYASIWVLAVATTVLPSRGTSDACDASAGPALRVD